MASGVDPHNVQSFLLVVVVLLNNIAESLVEPKNAVSKSSDDAPLVSRMTKVHDTQVDMNSIVVSVLHEFRFAHARTILDEEFRVSFFTSFRWHYAVSASSASWGLAFMATSTLVRLSDSGRRSRPCKSPIGIPVLVQRS